MIVILFRTRAAAEDVAAQISRSTYKRTDGARVEEHDADAWEAAVRILLVSDGD